MVGFGAAILAAAYSLSLPNYYRSEAQILPLDGKGVGGGLGNLAVAAAAFGVGIPGTDGSDGSYVDILASRWLREQLLNTEFHFHYRTSRFGSEIEAKETLFKHLGAKNMDRGVSALNEVLFANRDQKSRLLSIWAETRSPELSQQIVRRATSLLESYVLERGMTRGGNKAAFAEQRMKDAQKDYDAAEEEYSQFMARNRNFRLSSEPSVLLKGLRLDAELRMRQQLVSTLALSREQALMEEKNDLPILNVLDVGSVPFEKSRPARANLVLAIFFLGTVATWGWTNRHLVSALLVEN